MSFKIERFDKTKHKRTGFKCEEQSLTDYLKKQLTQDEKRNLAKGYVLVNEADETNAVLGFYTLTAFSVFLDANDLEQYQEQTTAKGFAKIPPTMQAPAVLIGRLARHIDLRGTRAGERLLMDALQAVLAVANLYAVHFVIVDAINDHANAFYKRYGFLEFGKVENRLYLPLKTIEQATA
ncbi:GNAT family N-acetyltransferase [Thiomicrorhabdus indica]|uniref:GNAT family N-acetyltransferase n=1 Tax=Thiomicrorhabdus indica TaxID=2267253 RepID=UPI00102D9957|nr:GNAT family N-acetyltransferase [Thiomicrorhabdus indica]